MSLQVSKHTQDWKADTTKHFPNPTAIPMNCSLTEIRTGEHSINVDPYSLGCMHTIDAALSYTMVK